MSNDLGLITLYDISTAKGAETWSPIVWRIRMVLNHKRIPYQTVWVELPDIGKVGRDIGAKPTRPRPGGNGAMLWTCPMLRDPNHLDSEGKPTVLSDSSVIVAYLDGMYPERKVTPRGTAALHYAWSQFIGQDVLMKLFPLVVPLCPDLLSERAKEYFIQTREEWFGPLKDMCPDREKSWAEVRVGLDKVAAALDANGGGEGSNLRVIPGQESYADFIIVAGLLWASAILGKEEMDELKSWNDGRWGRLLESYASLFRIE